MRKTSKNYIAFVLIISIFLISCQKKTYSDAEILLGTVVSIKLIDGGSADLIQQVFSRVKEIEEMMSISSDDYESTPLLDINKQSKEAYEQLERKKVQGHLGQTLKTDGIKNPNIVRNYVLPPDLAEVLKVSMSLAEQSEGNFDPTIAPLVDLWGFNGGTPLVPKEHAIHEQLKRVNWKNVQVKDNTLTLGLGQSIDVGAIAKGYAADVSKAYLLEQGVRAAILDFGGNIVVFGKKSSGEKWKIGIHTPYRAGEYLLILNTEEASIVTSGVYERYFEVDGKQYFHILDPHNGYPPQNSLLSVTIVYSKSIIADALSTAVFVMGLEKGYEFIESLVDTEAIFITESKDIVISSGLKDAVELIDEDYTLKNSREWESPSSLRTRGVLPRATGQDPRQHNNGFLCPQG